jgi:preprotein translocase subunit SecD
MDRPEARTSFVHRAHVLAAVAALLVLVAGCQASAPSSPGPSPVPPVDYTVRSPGSTPPPKTDTLRAIDILSARLRTLEVGMFSAAAGDAITFTIPATANPAAVRAVLSSTGQAAFVPLPPAEYGTGNRQGPLEAAAGKSLPTGEAPLFGGDQIADARATADATGGPMLSIKLASEGSRLFAAYSSAHVGEFFALLLDGRVVAAPLIQVAITDGAFNVTLPADALPMPVDALAAILASGQLPDSWKQGP